MENENQNGETVGQIKQWLQDNLRIIVSIIIVVAIAGGIYSYSKRTEAPVKEEISEESILSEEMQEDSSATEVTTATETMEVSSTPQSQETEGSFVVMAAKGNGTTHLARKALADYLEKNPDGSLAPEHKIYVEDYLRKVVGPKSVKIGTSVEFSKELIQDAIAKAKSLNERQIQNLHKYAVRVPSLK